jgi:hypothetical protein
MRLTKIDVVEAQIRAAVRMFFRDEHPVPVYTLANAAREIIATIGEQIEVETVQQEGKRSPSSHQTLPFRREEISSPRMGANDRNWPGTSNIRRCWQPPAQPPVNVISVSDGGSIRRVDENPTEFSRHLTATGHGIRMAQYCPEVLQLCSAG